MHKRKASQVTSSMGYKDSISGELVADQYNDLDQSSNISSVILPQDQNSDNEAPKESQLSKLASVVNTATDFDPDIVKEINNQRKAERHNSLMSGFSRGLQLKMLGVA